jgi:hypothetical protein
MSIIIKAYKTDNKHLIDLIDNLNKIDGDKIRNIAAHTLTAITNDFVKNQTGYNCGEIINLIKKVLPESGIFVSEEYWLAYENMNAMIKKSF